MAEKMDQKSKLYIKLAIVILVMIAGVSMVGKIMFSSYGNKPFQNEVDLCVAAFDGKAYTEVLNHLHDAYSLIPPASRKNDYEAFIKSEGDSVKLLNTINEWMQHPVLEITEWSFQAGKNYRDKYPPSLNDRLPDPSLLVVRNNRYVYQDKRTDMSRFNGRTHDKMFIKEGDTIWIAEADFTDYRYIEGVLLNDIMDIFPPEKSGEWFTISDIESHGAICNIRVVYPNARSVGRFVNARYNE